MKLDLKLVEYFGHKLTIAPRNAWLAADSDGQLWGYQNEPEMDIGDWRNTDALCEFICDVDLQGMDWKDTKVKV